MKINNKVLNMLITERNDNIVAWRLYLDSLEIKNSYDKLGYMEVFIGDEMTDKDVRSFLGDLMVTGNPGTIKGSKREEVMDDMTDEGFYPNSICGHFAMYEHPAFEGIKDCDWYQDVMCDNEHSCMGCNIVAISSKLIEADYDQHYMCYTKEQLSIIDPE